MLMKENACTYFFAVETNIHAGDAGVGRDGGGESDSGGL